MTGKTLVFKLAFGLLAGGLLFGTASNVRAEVSAIEGMQDSLKGLHTGGVGGAVNGLGAYNTSEDIKKQKEMGIDRGSDIRRINDTDIANMNKEAADLYDKAEGERAALRDAESANGGGSRTWGILTNWARTSEGREKRARMLADELEASGDLAGAAKAREAIEKASMVSKAKYLERNAQGGTDLDVFLDNDKNMYVYETTDTKGNPVKVYVGQDMNAVTGIMEGCMPIVVKLDQVRKCIFCPLFLILFNTAQSLSQASYKVLADGFSNVMLLAFALYIAFVSLKQVSSFTKQDGPKFITETLTQSFKVLLAYLILKYVDQLYGYLLSPMLSAGIEFGTVFLFRAKGSATGGSGFEMCMSATALRDGMTVAAGYYNTELFAQIDCFVRAVQEEIAVAQSIGSSLMCVARNANSHWYGMWDLTMFSSGLIVWLFTWLICLAFAFYLIDAVVRLGIVGALIPFLVAAWPFKITQGYTTKGWNMFMNSFFTFVFLGLVVSVNVELCGQAITGGNGGLEKVMDLMNQDKIVELNEIMSIGGMGLLFLILCCIFGFKLCSEAITLAQSMSEAKGGNIGSRLGSDAMGAAKWGATKGGKAMLVGGKAAGKALGSTETGKAITANVKEAAGKAGNAIASSKVGRTVIGVANKFKDADRAFGQNFGVAGKKRGQAAAASGDGNETVSSKESPKNLENQNRQDKPANDKQAPEALNPSAAMKNGNNLPAMADESANQAPTSASGNPQTAGDTDATKAAGEATPRGAGNDNGQLDKESLMKEAEERAAGAATAAARQQADQIAGEAKGGAGEQISEGDEKAKPEKSDSHKGNAESKIDSLDRDKKDLAEKINQLQAQIYDLENKLEKSKGLGGSTTASTSSNDEELLKKRTEERDKYKSQLDNLGK